MPASGLTQREKAKLSAEDQNKYALVVRSKEDAASELRDVDCSIDEPSEKEENETDEEYDQHKEDELKEKLDDIRSQLSDVLSNISCG